jgi:ketosteroid isomerase-like protein
MEATTLAGEAYTNEYCFVFRCEGDVIVRIQEFADTLLADAVFHFSAP